LTIPAGVGGGGLEIADAARQLGIPKSRVMKARSNVNKKVKEEIRRLTETQGEAGGAGRQSD
jgi:hypothetical protein